MNINERIILMCFVRDWYLVESTRQQVKTGRKFMEFSQTIQEIIDAMVTLNYAGDGRDDCESA